jgi:hypothetical protein
MDMNLGNFEPGTYIEIADTMHGFRKLGLVCDSGDMYFDLVDTRATPFPIYLALEPVAIGDTLAWGLELADQNPLEHQKFSILHKRLLDSGLDTLTLGRAAYWAYRNRCYEYNEALAAGRAATQEVVLSRGMMDGLIYNAAQA